MFANRLTSESFISLVFSTRQDAVAEKARARVSLEKSYNKITTWSQSLQIYNRQNYRQIFPNEQSGKI